MQPGSDILFGVSLSDFFLIIHWTFHGWYTLFHKDPLGEEDILCKLNAYISNVATVTQIYYNCLFCIVLFVKIRGSIFNATISGIYYHGLAVIYFIT